MQVIQSSADTSQVRLAGNLQNLQGITPGQQFEGVALNNARAGEMIMLQLADRQIQIRAAIAVTRGQTLVLERNPAAETTALKLSSPIGLPPQDLKIGTQVRVEVVKLLAEQRLLVSLSGNRPAGLPTHMEVDISALRQRFTAGTLLILEILRLQPLSVGIKPAPLDRMQLQRQLLPQLQTQPSNLTGLQQAFNDPQINRALQTPINQLLQNISPPQRLQQAGSLQQVLQQSGVFLERHLLNHASVNQDFKGNLMTLAAAIQSVLAQQINGTNRLTPLPPEIRQALTQLMSQPQGLQSFPAQIQHVLARFGRTPAQMLLQLLNGQTGNSMAQTLTAAQQAAGPTAQLHLAELSRLRVLLREVETTVARVQFNQLSMLRDPDSVSSNQVWLMDVPVKDKQHLQWMQLQIERERAQGYQQEDEDHWQVTLNLETLTLGMIQAAISLHQGVVNVTLTASALQTVEWLEQDLSILKGKLADLDLQVAHLRCRCAPVDWFSPAHEMEEQVSLLDISV